MSKFSKQKGGSTKPQAIRTTKTQSLTHEGALGFSRDVKSELFMLAASNFVGERTFYEKVADRDIRFRFLIHQATKEDPVWTLRFIKFLRARLNMRSAAIVAAVEYAAAGISLRGQAIEYACLRADEPAEALGYWLNTYGRPVPISVRRGIARAARRLYTERNALKWDGQTRDVRMADVIEMCHPKPENDTQSALFNYLLTTRHGNEPTDIVMSELELIQNAQALRVMPKDHFEEIILANPRLLDQAGMTWEQVGERVPNGMTAQVWEALIPTMGYMALLRNLRNFDQAKISTEAVASVVARLTDPVQVARSRQFPLRFYSAWKNAGSMLYGQALEEAITLSLQNVPKLKGRTLILIDMSGSMSARFGGERSTMTLMEAATVFGLALSMAAEEHRTVLYATKWEDAGKMGGSLLRNVDGVIGMHRHLGGGTNTMQALGENFGVVQRPYGNFDRVIILTDEQAHPGRKPDLGGVPLYTFNLAGYRTAMTENGVNNQYAFGGLSDAAFTLLPLLEARQAAGWDALFGEEK